MASNASMIADLATVAPIQVPISTASDDKIREQAALGRSQTDATIFDMLDGISLHLRNINQAIQAKRPIALFGNVNPRDKNVKQAGILKMKRTKLNRDVAALMKRKFKPSQGVKRSGLETRDMVPRFTRKTNDIRSIAKNSQKNMFGESKMFLGQRKIDFKIAENLGVSPYVSRGSIM